MLLPSYNCRADDSRSVFSLGTDPLPPSQHNNISITVFLCCRCAHVLGLDRRKAATTRASHNFDFQRIPHGRLRRTFRGQAVLALGGRLLPWEARVQNLVRIVICCRTRGNPGQDLTYMTEAISACFHCCPTQKCLQTLKSN